MHARAPAAGRLEYEQPRRDAVRRTRVRAHDPARDERIADGVHHDRAGGCATPGAIFAEMQQTMERQLAEVSGLCVCELSAGMRDRCRVVHVQEVRAGLDRALNDSDELVVRCRAAHGLHDARRAGFVHLVLEARDDLLEGDACVDLDNLDGVFCDCCGIGHICRFE